MNGNYGGRNMGAGMGAGGAGTNDALYVGDLQWVRIFLPTYHGGVLLWTLCSRLFFSCRDNYISLRLLFVRTHSGLRTKTFGK